MKKLLLSLLLTSSIAFAGITGGTADAPTNTNITSMTGLTGSLSSPTFFNMTQIATPANPSASHDRLYCKSDDNLYILNSSGVEVQVGGSTVSFGAFGSSPNSNGGTITAGVINLQPFDGTHPGGVLSSGGGTTNFLRADGTWAAPGGGITALTGDVTASGSGSVAATVAKIQGTTVSGTTGSGNVVFSASPTLSGTLTAPIITTGTANPASAGAYRFANAELLEWRNAANSGDLNIGYDASNRFQVSGVTQDLHAQWRWTASTNTLTLTDAPSANTTSVFFNSSVGGAGGSVQADNFIMNADGSGNIGVDKNGGYDRPNTIATMATIQNGSQVRDFGPAKVAVTGAGTATAWTYKNINNSTANLPASSSFTWEAICTSQRTDSAGNASWVVQGAGHTDGTPTLTIDADGSLNQTAIFASAAIAGTTLRFIVNGGAAGQPILQVTGVAATNQSVACKVTHVNVL